VDWDTTQNVLTQVVENHGLIQNQGLPAWLSVGANANVVWNQAAETLKVNAGVIATIIADPMETRFNGGLGDDPTITVTGAGAELVVDTDSANNVPSTADNSLFVHLGGINLQSGGSMDIASWGAARTHNNHEVVVLGTTTEIADPTIIVDSAHGSAINAEDNDIIAHAINGTPFSTLQGLAATGRNVAPGGLFDGKWNGPGLNSSVAAAYDVPNVEQYVLGVAQYGDMLFGFANNMYTVGASSEPLNPNDAIVKFTYNGDLGLEGAVNGDASTLFSAFFDGGASVQNDFVFGDLNGDKHVDGTDATIFSAFFLSGVPNNGQGQPSIQL
jgi:hypothetical protein